MYFHAVPLPNKAAYTAGPWVFESCAFGFSTVPALTLETSQTHGLGAIAVPEKGNEEQWAELQDTSMADLFTQQAGFRLVSNTSVEDSEAKRS